MSNNTERSEDGQMWADIKARDEERRQALQDERMEAVKLWAFEAGVECEERAGAVIRLRHGGYRIDYFPQSNKFHDITFQERGQIQGDGREFFKKRFGL